MQFIYIPKKVMPRKPQRFVMCFITFAFLGSKQLQKHQDNRENVLCFSELDIHLQDAFLDHV